MQIPVILLLASGLFITASCQKDDHTNRGQNLSEAIIGTYHGVASFGDQRVPDDFILEVTASGPSAIIITGESVEPETFELIRDEVFGTISSFEKDSHLMVYEPEEEILTIVRLNESTNRITFDGTKY